MVAFGASGGTPKQRMVQMAAGLGILPGVIVDQHFQQRNRLGRLLAIIAQNPSLLGLGIDEDTAGVVGPDMVMEVIGRRSVTIVDGAGSETDAWEVRAHRPIMISNVVLHSLPGGLPVRPASTGARRGADAAGPRHRRARVELTETPPMAEADTTPGPGGRARPTRASRVAEGDQAAPDDPRSRPLAAGPIAPTLRILETRVLRGPNVWVRRPVIRMIGRPGRARGVPLQHHPRLQRGAHGAAADAWRTTPARSDDVAASSSRLADGTWMGHVAEHIALELQCLAGTDVRIGKTRSTGETRSLRRHLRVPRGAGRPRGRPHRGRARQPPGRARRPRRRPRPAGARWSGSSASRSAPRSGPRRRPSSTRPSRATSRGSGSTATAWCSWARASTSSASGPR